MKQLLSSLLCCTLLAAPVVQALDLDNLNNIDSIMEDNALNEEVHRYSALKLSFFPEEATRIGYESADGQMDERTPERDAQAQRAYHIIEETLKNVKRTNLSEPKKTEYDMLQAQLAFDRWDLNRGRINIDPLLYTEAFDSIYDLTMKTLTFKSLQNRDLAKRLAALPKVAQQAEANLTTPPSFLSQLAMEKAYYAYLSFDILPKYLQSRAQDIVSRNQLITEAKESKAAVKKMFDLFKKLAQENTEQDFRLGERDYAFVLKNKYLITDKPRVIEKLLVKNFKTAQQNLAKALDTFAQIEKAAEAETLVADIQVPGEEGQEDASVTVIEGQPAPTVKKSAKKNKNQPLVKASDFYALSERLIQGVKEQDFLKILSKEAADLSQFFVKDSTLPTAIASFNIQEMPAYYGYFKPYLFLPPFGMQSNASSDFFLRLPSGNELTKQEMLNKDFNAFTLKLMISGQLVPGLYYAANFAGDQTSSFRQLYPVPTLKNGWEVYAQHLAKERGYIVTDEELLFLAWADYVRATEALVDFYLQTRHYTYSDALAFLTEENGFDKAQAEAILKRAAAQPGEAVSYIYGYDALKNLRAKYQKKLGKKFSLSDFHSKLLRMGYIPTNRLEAEMEYAYKLEKTHLTQALSSPFYMM